LFSRSLTRDELAFMAKVFAELVTTLRSQERRPQAELVRLRMKLWECQHMMEWALPRRVARLESAAEHFA
jgi:hypothetical protein